MVLQLPPAGVGAPFAAGDTTMATRTSSHTGTPEAPEDPVFGHLGVLAVDELADTVQCHRCGRWFRSLAGHVWRAHGMSADAYRAVFELNARHGLVSPSLSERRRRQALQALRPYYERAAELARSLSFEQRSAMMRGRRLRLETRLSPRWQASKQAMGRRQSARL